ncbi:transposase [Cupriavidus lacunae]|uniref:transposase n=1 Tax=Cupriavidus lacunae TaxID=2666307 RepID=UPI001FCA0360|nr:transposase [Cupriavidus lacunae]
MPKTLAQRMHVCTHCGHTAPRDQNAASVVLIDAHTPGTGVAARPKPLARQRAKSKSVTRETPATASTDAWRWESSCNAGVLRSDLLRLLHLLAWRPSPPCARDWPRSLQTCFEH